MFREIFVFQNIIHGKKNLDYLSIIKLTTI